MALYSLVLHCGMADQGGIACELRYQDQAQATRDLDALFRGSLDKLLTDLDTTFASACTKRFPDRENERVHDLIDLQLMEELIEHYGRVKTACIEIFELRRTHSWPPTLTIEPTWSETYRELAAELDFPTKDIADAIARVQALVERTQYAATDGDLT